MGGRVYVEKVKESSKALKYNYCATKNLRCALKHGAMMALSPSPASAIGS
jgi:hypothetical protein